jgi:hypothetical protein
MNDLGIYGENFCWSAGRAFKMLSNNALRVMAINSVGDFILFLGKAGVVTAVVFVGIELIKVLISFSLYSSAAAAAAAFLHNAIIFPFSLFYFILFYFFF